MAVWGDDTSTADDIDGLLAGQETTFQLVDGNSLYDLNLTFGGSNSYVTITIYCYLCSTTLNCTDESIVSSCDLGLVILRSHLQIQVCLYFWNPNSLLHLEQIFQIYL